LICDDKSDAQSVKSGAAQLCSQGDVLGVVGHYNSDVSIAASEIYGQCRFAMITPIASNPELTERNLPNVFRFTNRDDRTGLAMAEYLYQNLGKRRVVVVESTPPMAKAWRIGLKQHSVAWAVRLFHGRALKSAIEIFDL